MSMSYKYKEDNNGISTIKLEPEIRMYAFTHTHTK